MIIRVYEDGVTENKEQEFFLKLVQRGEAVNLMLVDKKGKQIENTILLQIKPNMTLYRYTCINNRLELPLDERNRLKEEHSAY